MRYHRGLLGRERIARGSADHTLRRSSKELAHLRVRHQVVAIEVLEIHADRGVLHEGGETRFAGLERRLGPLPLSDVECKAAHHRDLTTCIPDRKADHDAPLIGVQARLVLLVEKGPTRGQDLLMVPLDERRLHRWEDLGGRPADHLAWVAPEDLGRFGVGQQVVAGAVLQVNNERSIVHERGETGLTLTQRLLDAPPLGDVGDHAQDRWLAAIVQRPRGHDGVELATIGSAHPNLGLLGAAVGRDAPHDFGPSRGHRPRCPGSVPGQPLPPRARTPRGPSR